MQAMTERELRNATGDSETLLLTPLGAQLYRLEESSVIADAVYKDVIRATEAEDGALLLIEIAERSPLVTNSFVATQDFIECEAIQSILKAVMDEGGNWEQVFGGVLLVHTSPIRATQIEDQIRRIAGERCPKLNQTMRP